MAEQSIIERMIAEALRKPPRERMVELERVLEVGKLTLPQIKEVQAELFALRKRLKK